MDGTSLKHIASRNNFSDQWTLHRLGHAPTAAVVPLELSFTVPVGGIGG